MSIHGLPIFANSGRNATFRANVRVDILHGGIFLIRLESAWRSIMADETQYKYLAPRYGSSYRQYFLKGSKLRAEVLFGETVGPDARTPEEGAEDYEVPVAAVYESMRSCPENQDVLLQDSEMETTSVRGHGLHD